jgi:hypothetical protein
MVSRAAEGGRESSRRRGGGWRVGGSSPALFRAPTPHCSASCSPPGHAPPAPLAPESPQRPPERPQSRLRKMGAPGLTPLRSLLLLLMLGKPGPHPSPAQPGRCLPPGVHPARLPSISELLVLPTSPLLRQVCDQSRLLTSLCGPSVEPELGQSEEPPRYPGQAHFLAVIPRSWGRWAQMLRFHSASHSATGLALGACSAWAVPAGLHNCPRVGWRPRGQFCPRSWK